VFNTALVGFGYAGRTFHAPLIAACPGLKLHTVVSSQTEAVHEAYPEARVAELDAALADPAVELVVIATPNDTHAPLARRALEAGKAVVVDKPFTLSLAEARELIASAEARGRLLSVFHNRRWDADFLTLQALIAEGRLGRLVRFESRFDRYRPAVRDRWREAAGPGSGVWFDLGPHLIDQALQLFGRPLAITCDLAVMREGGAAPDYAHAVLRYDRLRVVLHADMLSPAADLRFAVHGERASFLKEGLDPQEAQLAAGMIPGAPGWGEDPRPGVLVEGASGARVPVPGVAGDYRRFYRAVAAALAGEGPNPISAKEAAEVMAVLEAGVLSGERRSEIPL